MKSLGRLAALLLVSLAALQLFFAARIAMMAVIDPQSTTFQRSEVWRLLTERGEVAWRQQWVDGDRISHHLKRAVIASEDAGFTEHGGVDWDALEKAWEKNQRAEARADQFNLLQEQRRAHRPAQQTHLKRAEPKVIGGSTITQQLAKNLFLTGERSLARKGQEFVITFMLETLLPKERILDIYLNNVEWGEGVFGAEAAATHYFRVPAASLGTAQAARLAVMLPAPKRFEKRPASGYLLSRAAVIQARMGAVDLP